MTEGIEQQKKVIIEKMNDCLDYADLKGFEEQVNGYIKSFGVAIACQDLSVFLVKHYTAARADTIAKQLEIIIQCNPELALINYPENQIFRVVMITGSIELFNCYTEKAIEPHLVNASKEERKTYYQKLLQLGVQLNQLFSDQYHSIIKGMDYNGAFSQDSETGVVSIHGEDYEIMNDTINKFNTIVGRREVITELMTLVGMKF